MNRIDSPQKTTPSALTIPMITSKSKSTKSNHFQDREDDYLVQDNEDTQNRNQSRRCCGGRKRARSVSDHSQISSSHNNIHHASNSSHNSSSSSNQNSKHNNIVFQLALREVCGCRGGSRIMEKVFCGPRLKLLAWQPVPHVQLDLPPFLPDHHSSSSSSNRYRNRPHENQNQNPNHDHHRDREHYDDNEMDEIENNPHQPELYSHTGTHLAWDAEGMLLAVSGSSSHALHTHTGSAFICVYDWDAVQCADLLHNGRRYRNRQEKVEEEEEVWAIAPIRAFQVRNPHLSNHDYDPLSSSVSVYAVSITCMQWNPYHPDELLVATTTTTSTSSDSGGAALVAYHLASHFSPTTGQPLVQRILVPALSVPSNSTVAAMTLDAASTRRSRVVSHAVLLLDNSEGRKDDHVLVVVARDDGMRMECFRHHSQYPKMLWEWSPAQHGLGRVTCLQRVTTVAAAAATTAESSSSLWASASSWIVVGTSKGYVCLLDAAHAVRKGMTCQKSPHILFAQVLRSSSSSVMLPQSSDERMMSIQHMIIEPQIMRIVRKAAASTTTETHMIITWTTKCGWILRSTITLTTTRNNNNILNHRNNPNNDNNNIHNHAQRAIKQKQQQQQPLQKPSVSFKTTILYSTAPVQVETPDGEIIGPSATTPHPSTTTATSTSAAIANHTARRNTHHHNHYQNSMEWSMPVGLQCASTLMASNTGGGGPTGCMILCETVPVTRRILPHHDPRVLVVDSSRSRSTQRIRTTTNTNSSIHKNTNTNTNTGAATPVLPYPGLLLYDDDLPNHSIQAIPLSRRTGRPVALSIHPSREWIVVATPTDLSLLTVRGFVQKRKNKKKNRNHNHNTNHCHCHCHT